VSPVAVPGVRLDGADVSKSWGQQSSVSRGIRLIFGPVCDGVAPICSCRSVRHKASQPFAGTNKFDGATIAANGVGKHGISARDVTR
jgi:hypothetical protein